MTIPEVLDGLVADCAQVAPSTRDPQRVQPMQAQTAAPVIFVDVPRVAAVGLRGVLTLTIPIHIVVCQPGLLADHDKAYPLLAALIPVLQPRQEFQPVALQLGDTYYPAYRTTVERKA